MRDRFAASTQSLVTAIGRSTDADVALAAPRATTHDVGIDVHLLQLHPGSRELHRGFHRLPVELEHLVAVGGGGDEVAGIVYDVIVAIEASADHRLDCAEVPLDWWRTFGVTPRPALRVRTALHVDRVVDEAPVVTEPLAVDTVFHRAAVGAPSYRKA